MKYLIIIFLIISSDSFSQGTKDSVAIVQLLINDYNALNKWDIKSHMSNCTDNYLLIEDGEIWDMKMEAEYFRKNASRAIDRKNSFAIRYVRVYGDFAYAVYGLRSDIKENGTYKVKNWTESSSFRKIKGIWKIELIHSTVIDEK